MNIDLTDLKISRPGLWFPTLWIYLVPFSSENGFWKTIPFWLGILFVTFPLNYLVYGLNDYNDQEADAINDRKGNFLFGAKASREQLIHVPRKVIIVILPFILLFSFMSGYKMFLLLIAMVVFNVIYNFKPFRFKERPPFEIFIQIGYVLTVYFCTELNTLEAIPWQTSVYLMLFAFQAHIAGEIMDIEPDLISGKKTTATILKRKKTKLLMLLLLMVEVYILWFWFKDVVLAAFLALFSIWMFLDVFILFKEKPYTLSQMKLFGYAINISAIISMAWALYSGTLMNPVF